MKTICTAMGLAAAAIAAGTVSARAEEAAKPLTVVIDNYATYDDAGALVSNHELDFTLEGTAGAWTLGAEAWFGVMAEYATSTLTLEIPTLLLYAKSDAFGEIDAWDASNALGNACVTPPGGSTHFGSEDLMAFGTCAGYSGQALTYITPDFFDGFGLQVSVMKDLEGQTAAGEVDSSVSAALTYTRTTETDVTYSASLGVDAATSLNGGVPAGTALPVTVQGGGSVGWDGWTVGGAAQYEFASLSGGNSWGLGLGVSKDVTEQLTLGAELAIDGYEDAAAAVIYREFSLGTTAEYKILDNASIDAGLNAIRVIGDDGSDTISWQIGTGLSISF
ncbi:MULTISPECIES: hypothetical protein [unclassified Devosia]|uniref:hypothetical protein n=1 Tax=unclassified Devosia TaxID=196773 RepID=UPI001ACB5FE4|nr:MULTISPECIES: hypothetical protein [unclassified Devosia]MBN9305581.1 hypothetical protein [Devosia sp.]